MNEADLIRCLRVLSWSNEDRVIIFGITRLPRAKAGQEKSVKLTDEAEWFLRRIDDLAPELHRREWVTYAEFTCVPGEVVVTNGKGDVRAVVITQLGRLQLAAVLS